MTNTTADDETPFAALTPDAILSAVEALDLRTDGRLLTLNSYENRVYRIGIEDAAPVVAKFYRPRRWTDEAIIEEHAFARELADADLAVAVPMRFDDATLHHHVGHRYAIFPSIGGRAPEPDDRATLRLLGRTLGRLHAVGAGSVFRHRQRLSLNAFGREPVEFLIANRWLPVHLEEPFQRLAHELLSTIESRWTEAGTIRSIRLHGDCHPGNVLQLDDQLVLVDLDDALTGPAIQDLWMLVSGNADDVSRQFGWLLEGYSLFREFDTRELSLIEPLRTLRLLHFNAWIARRWQDPAFPAAFPAFAENRHWENLIGQMHEQLALLHDPPRIVP
jgi:Ser/Thr protein kinase RdoA (MazF antagonist)